MVYSTSEEIPCHCSQVIPCGPGSCQFKRLSLFTYIHLCHVQITVNKAVDGKHATITAISAGGASDVSTGAAGEGGEASTDINMAAGPSQQPAKANPPDQVCACWLVDVVAVCQLHLQVLCTVQSW